MRVVAYVRGDAARAAAQERAIRTWAQRGGHAIVSVQHDLADAPLRDRFGLAAVLDAVRAEPGTTVAVAALHHLSEDLVEQELLVSEVARAGGAVRSSDRGEELALAEPDEARALVRRALSAMGGHRDAMRDLDARARIGKIPPEDRENASLARIEQLAELGLGVRAIAETLTDEGYAPRWSRVFNPGALRRLIAAKRAATP